MRSSGVASAWSVDFVFDAVMSASISPMPIDAPAMAMPVLLFVGSVVVRRTQS